MWHWILTKASGLWDWAGANSQALGAIGTLAAVAVAAIYAFFTHRLWQATRAQAEITRRMFEASHRPYVQVKIDIESFFNDPELYGLEFDIIHHGQVPAVLIGWAATITREQDRVRIERVSPPDWRRTLYPGGEKTIEVLAFTEGGAVINQSAPPIRTTFALRYRGSHDTAYRTRVLIEGGHREWRVLDYEQA